MLLLWLIASDCHAASGCQKDWIVNREVATVLGMKLPFSRSARQDARSGKEPEAPRATVAGNGDHALSPEAEDSEKLLHQRLSGLRDRLLDLSNRNRLLSFKHSDRSRTHVRIIDELPDVLFAKLKNEDKLTFQALPEPETRPLDEESDEFLLALEAARATDEEYRHAIRTLVEGESEPAHESKIDRALRDRVREQLGMPPWVNQSDLSKVELARSHGLEPSYDVPEPHTGEADEKERHLDKLIQTLLFPREMDRKLAGIRDQARTIQQEAGVNTLYAAFGFLEWREAQRSDRKNFSPLLLLPVSLEYKRGQPWGRYRLFSEMPDVETNKTLEIRLGLEFGFEMPKFGEDDTPESYIEKFKEAIQNRPDWRVRRFLTVGNFGFSKLPMYNDLDPVNWPAGQGIGNRALIRTILLGSSNDDETPITDDDYEIDSTVVDDKQIVLVTDADASQHSAVIDAIDGKNLVIKGPPGTGKSQTITNIIAASLAKKKRVLFIAEKMAALEVVDSRLKDAGLGDFCLQVHSTKTSKMEVLESLRRRLDLQQKISAPEALNTKLAELRDHRSRLNTYVVEMNRPLGATGLTVRQIFWGEKRAKADAGEASSLLQGIAFENPDTVDTLARSQAHNAIRGAFDRAVSLSERYGSLDQHPWAWIRNEYLSPFQIEELVQAGHDWLESLDRLNDSMEELGSRLVPIEIDCTQNLSHTAEAIGALPDLSEPFVVVLASSLVELDLGTAASELSELLGRNNGGDAEESSVRLPLALPPLSENWREKAGRTKEALIKIEQYCRELYDIEGVQQEIAHLEMDEKQLRRLLEITGQLRSAAGLTSEPTQGSVAVALTALGLMKAATREILLNRAPEILEEAAEITLTRAAAKAKELASIRDGLDQVMVLRPLPELKEVVSHGAALRSAGALGFLSSRVREAKRYFRSLATEPRNLDVERMIERGARLAAYLDERRVLAEDQPLAAACGSQFNGSETDFELLLEVNRWGRNVRRWLPGAMEYGALRQFLLEGSIDDIVALAEAAGQLDIEKAVRLIERVKKQGHGPEQSHALLNERTKSLKAAIAVLGEEGIGSQAPLAVVAGVCERLTQLEPLRARLTESLPSVKITPKLLIEAVDFVDGLLSAGLPPSALNALALDASSFEFDGLRMWARQVAEKLSVEAEKRRAFQNLADLNLEQLCHATDIELACIHLLRERLRSALADHSGLKDHLDLQGALNRARQFAPLGFVEKLIAKPQTSVEAIAAYDWLLYRGLARIAFEKIPDLSLFNGVDLHSARQKFQQLDREILRLEREHLRSALCSLNIPYGNGVGRKSSFTDRALIQNELSKRKRHIPLRQLFVRASGAIKQMQPCFMMSPLSVATYLPPGKFEFDLVVIDEASQMPPEDALGAVARSAQVVVVGDPMQLPPTSFFKRFDDVMDEDDDEEEDENVDVESILDQAHAVFRPPRELRWHYRSRHQSLIAFSNKHFYNDGLTVFPSPIEEDENLGVRLVKVDGLYADQHNPLEAQEIAAWAQQFMLTRPNESLGLVAINQLQRDLLMDEMGRIFQRDSRAEAYRRSWEGTLYPFFIKNLENVQGDERDVIAISLVRAPNADGKVTQNFGPISQKNGHRRLNVLFTRARNQLVLFSSITPEQIEIRPNTAQGPRILRSYLDYALTGRLDPGSGPSRPPDSDFEVAVANRLLSHGYEVVPQVGVGGFYVDLGIRHPEFPGIFLVGVECDGATYHSAKSARDRDRLREEVLVGLKWKLYRIWSTDWFADPDAETKKLCHYIEMVAEERRALVQQASVGDKERKPVAHSAEAELSDVEWEEAEYAEDGRRRDGEIDQFELLADTNRDGTTDTHSRRDVTLPRSAASVVEVGDTVTFHFENGSDERRVVTIVAGVSDADQNYISRDSPIGSALLGAAIGEDVEVDAPNGVRTMVIDDTSKPQPPGGKSPHTNTESYSRLSNLAVNASERTPEPRVFDGPSTISERAQNIEAYRAWKPRRLPDPRDAQRSDVARHLKEIIQAEGPVRVNRAYRLYARACDIDRVGRVVRSKLNSALYHLAHQNQVCLEKEGPDDSQINAVARLPDMPMVSVRPAGDRTFWDIPPSELAAVMVEERTAARHVGAEEIYHQVLARYGIGRLTTKIRTELARIDRAIENGRLGRQ